MALRKRKLWVLGMALVLIIAGILLSIHLLSTPAQGTISQSGSQGTKTEAPKLAHQYSDNYMSFIYPGTFDLVPVAKANNYLDIVNLSSNDRSNAYVAITVVRELLSNDPSLNYRRLHPEIYQVDTSDPTDATFTSTQNGFEKTGYIAHGGLVLSVSLSSSFSNDLSAIYGTIVKSLQWK